MFKTLAGKLLTTYMVITLLVILAVGILVSHLLSEHFMATRTRELMSKGQEITELAEEVLTARGMMGRNVLPVLDLFIDARIWIINDKGQIVSASHQRPGRHGMRMEPGDNLPEADIGTLLSGETITKERSTRYFDISMITVGLPVESRGEVVGGILLHAPVRGIQALVWEIQRNLLYATIPAILLAVAVSFWLSRSISRPLVEMETAARSMAQGDFDRRVQVTSRDEVGTLARSFNRLASRLAESLKALSQEKEKLAHTVNSINEGVIACNPELETILINPPALHLFRPDWTADKSMGRPLDELLGEERLLSLFRKVLNRAQKRSEIIELDYGPTLWIQISPICDPSSQCIGAVALIHDIRNLDRLDELERDFIAGVSHELKTPLTAIRSHIEPLLDGTAEDEEMRQRFLETIREESLNLKQLIDDLLDYSRLQQGQLTPKTEDFPIHEMVEEILSTLTPRYAEKGLTVECELPEEPLIVTADPALIRQVLSNLIDNAMRFISPGDRITIRAKDQEDLVGIEVCDTGPGIADEDLPFIWNRFYRGTSARTPNDVGWGLGLALTREILEAHGQTIEITTEKGRGSRFSFTLPRPKDA